MKKNDILVTRKAYEVKGGLFDQQIMKKGKGQVAIKGNDERLIGTDGINKYGGYNKATGAYFMLVESKDKKGNLIRTIEFIPLYLKKKVESDKIEKEYEKDDCDYFDACVYGRKLCDAYLMFRRKRYFPLCCKR